MQPGSFFLIAAAARETAPGHLRTHGRADPTGPFCRPPGRHQVSPHLRYNWECCTRPGYAQGIDLPALMSSHRQDSPIPGCPDVHPRSAPRPNARGWTARVAGLLLALNSLAAVQAADLVLVPHPDLMALEPDVRQQLEPGVNFFKAQRSRLEGRELGLAYGRIATNYLAHDQSDAAEACFNNAAALDPENPRWPYLLAYIYQHTDRPEAAVDAYRQSLIISPRYLQGYVRLGQSLVTLERYDEAEAAFQVVLELVQDQPAALVGAGDVAMGRGAYSDAIGLYRRALRLEPEARAIYRKIADAERAAGDDDAADKAMSQANDRDPGIQDPLLAFVEAHGKGARFYRESGERALAEGDTPLAINLYEIASSIAPYDANTWLRLSELQRSAGDGKAAFSSLMRLVAYDPENAAAHFQIGNTLERLGDTAGAERHYALALESEPNLVEPNMALAGVLMRRGAYLEAGDHYSRVAQLLPGSVDARYLLGLAWLAAEKCEWAQQALSGALALQPEDKEIVTAIVRAYSTCSSAAQEQRERALVAAKALYDDSPGKDTAETLAMAFAANGLFEDAVDLQTQAIFEALKQGDETEVTWLQQNMTRYQAGEMAALPWRPDAEIYRLKDTASGAPSS